MAKHRKTRKEKLRSENRQQHVLAASLQETTPSQENRSFSFTFSPDEKVAPAIHSSKNPQTANDYAFVKHDLIKTGVVMSSIVAAELLLFIFIR